MRTILPLFLILAACDRGPEVPTATENAELDSAAEMLDEADNNLAAIDANALLPANLIDQD